MQARGDVYIAIVDNGIGISEEMLMELDLEKANNKETSGIGLRNVHQRIQMYYGKEYGLTIESHFGIDTKVTIHIPYRQ